MVYGFNWKLPASVLRTPRLGVINVHSSLLPRYRGPAPVLWAIRNGDAEIGLTVHRMDEQFDTGPILAQRGGIALGEDVSPQRLWQRVRPVLDEVLTVALDEVAKGLPGVPQDDAGASYAGFVEPEFSLVDWSRTAVQVHNQVRMFGFMGPDHAPVAEVGGRWLKVLRTRLRPADGIRVQCADAPIWIVESAPAQSPLLVAECSGDALAQCAGLGEDAGNPRRGRDGPDAWTLRCSGHPVRRRAAGTASPSPDPRP
ncbi:methionyl-tRNA formyltransferase [Asanoa hainanensis]|uniref:Methionyl-tRNA formyltransferase n=1 Tax=Asanoa hainanensis TaxID=560556 RepID=A0A239NP79_9ACTN|nr:methionyl-tRNA formyltransferase [Asanoa hainanensis]